MEDDQEAVARIVRAATSGQPLPKIEPIPRRLSGAPWEPPPRLPRVPLPTDLDVHPVEAARVRLAHALSHCELLNEEVRVFMKRDPIGAVAEDHREQGRYVVRAKVVERPPSRLGLIAGDAVHAIRAALDNLFWGFAVRHNDPPVDPQATFPVFADVVGRRGWKTVGQQAKTAGLVGPVIAEKVARVQPCFRSPNDPRGDPLWVLQRLWNDDKHKRIVPVGGSTARSGMYMGNVMVSGGFAGPYFNNGAFQDGDVLAGFDYNPAGHFHGDFNFEFAFFVAFPETGPARGAPLAEFTRHLHDHVVNEVLPLFEGL